MWPSILIIVGVVLVNFTTLCHHCVSSTVGQYLFGLGCALIGLVTGVGSIVLNARFLKREIVSPALWSSLVGASTLFWVFFLAAGHYAFDVNPVFWSKLWQQEKGHEVFWIGGLLLGVVSGWLGAYFWNIASKRVLISLGGQLIILETLFGILMVYTYGRTVPSLVEFAGIVILLISVVWSTRAMFQLQSAKQLEAF
jgi:drug/metabolite transporter (DMT)-like permease